MFIIQSADLSHIFGCDLEQNQTGVITKGEGPYYPQNSCDIIRIHSLMIYSDIIEYNLVCDTKTPLLRCSFHFQSKKWRHNIYRKVHELSILYKSTI